MLQLINTLQAAINSIHNEKLLLRLLRFKHLSAHINNWIIIIIIIIIVVIIYDLLF